MDSGQKTSFASRDINYGTCNAVNLFLFVNDVRKKQKQTKPKAKNDGRLINLFVIAFISCIYKMSLYPLVDC